MTSPAAFLYSYVAVTVAGGFWTGVFAFITLFTLRMTAAGSVWPLNCREGWKVDVMPSFALTWSRHIMGSSPAKLLTTKPSGFFADSLMLSDRSWAEWPGPGART